MANVGVTDQTVLMHPVRMGVVAALGAERLTTREIHERMPEVAQASLYRAVARLEAAGVIEVTSRRRKGGAVERVYGLTGAASIEQRVIALSPHRAAALRAEVSALLEVAAEPDAPGAVPTVVTVGIVPGPQDRP